MEKNTKILLGVAGAGVLAYLLWKNSKKPATTENKIPEKVGAEQSSSTTYPSDTYIVVQDIVYGYKPNTGEPNIVFRKGDKVQGKIEERYIFNRNTKGIMATPTVEGAYVETPDGKTFIEAIYLQTPSMYEFELKNPHAFKAHLLDNHL